MTLERMNSQPGSTIKQDALSDFPLFLILAIASFDNCCGSCGAWTCRGELWW